MLDVNLRLFSERLKRVLAGEEGTLTLPDSTNLTLFFQNLLTESEIITTTLLGNYEADMAWLLVQNLTEEDVDRPDILGILKDINYFVHESEKTIDTFFIAIMQPQNSESTTCKELCDALLGLESKIIDITNRLQQLPLGNHDWDLNALRDIQIDSDNSSGSAFNDISEFERGREEFLDLLIEGHPRLSVVSILDSRGFDKTAFAAETFNNNHVKFYFDCRAFVRVSGQYNFRRILDDIMKYVMPASSFGEIMGEDYESKKTHLRDYLTNKKYFIVLDDVWDKDIWDDLREALPDYENGSRVLVTIAVSETLTLFELENGEKIRFDSVLDGPLIRIKYEVWQLFILHYGSTPLANLMRETQSVSIGLKYVSLFHFPFSLKVCCLYLCLFDPSFEISTKQLYQFWIAEGFILDNSEETAEDYLKELINSGFFQVHKRRAGGTIKSCYVQTLLLLMLVKAVEMTEFFQLIDKDLEEKSWKTIKRFSIFRNLSQFLSSEHSDTYLYSLLNFTSESNHPAIIDCMKTCKKFKLLRILNLGSLVLGQYPSGLENLFYLRYLKLNIPSLRSLPSSLCTLLNLYTLDMPSSYIDHTPEDIWKMHKLMHLNFGSITLPAPPKQYCSSLKNLIFISALHPSSCTPDILGRLPNIQTLRIYGDLSYYQSAVSKSLCELQNLQCLKMVNESKKWQLSRMVLSEYQLPPSLAQLSLSNTVLMDDPMPTLEKFRHLHVLKLKQNSYSGRKLACVDSGGFPQLKILHLKSMHWLEEWTMGAGAMPKLESLIINPCAYLKKLPEELWRTENLCKLEIHWPQPELRKRLRAFEDMERRYDIEMYPYGI